VYLRSAVDVRSFVGRKRRSRYASLFPSNVHGLVLMEPALYALYPSEASPPAIDRMRREIIPMFQRGDIGEGIKSIPRTASPT